MKCSTWRAEFQHRHVLNEEGIYTCIPQVEKQPARILQFVVVENGIDRDIDLNPKWMGIAAQPTDVFDTIASRRPGSKTRSSYIYGICTMVDSRDATFKILCRSQ